MPLDQRALGELLTESDDLQSDARATHRRILPDLREIGRARRGRAVDLDEVRAYRDARRTVLRRGGFGLGALAAKGLVGTSVVGAVSAIVARPVSAQTDVDVQILQTAASLENLAVATYEAALGLPFFAENQVVVTFAETTRDQHAEHGAAFNTSAEALGGEPQTGPNPVLEPMVQQALPGLTDYAAVVELAAMLEETAQDTYLANLSMLTDADTKGLMGSVMAVETQHLAVLRAVGALLAGGAPQLIAIPTDVAALPAAAGSVAFPEPLEEPDLARSPEEGAL